MSRRDLILRVLQSAGTAALVPLVSLQQAQASPDVAENPQESWKPLFFTTGQNDSLTAIGQRILPGSAAAQCNRVIDLVMTVETPEVREQLLNAIAAFEGTAHSQHAKSFKDLGPEQQDRLVAAYAQHPDPAQPFGLIKEWLADVYWSSRDGLHELGWNGQVAWPSFPACDAHANH